MKSFDSIPLFSIFIGHLLKKKVPFWYGHQEHGEESLHFNCQCFPHAGMGTRNKSEIHSNAHFVQKRKQCAKSSKATLNV